VTPGTSFFSFVLRWARERESNYYKERKERKEEKGEEKWGTRLEIKNF